MQVANCWQIHLFCPILCYSLCKVLRLIHTLVYLGAHFKIPDKINGRQDNTVSSWDRKSLRLVIIQDQGWHCQNGYLNSWDFLKAIIFLHLLWILASHGSEMDKFHMYLLVICNMVWVGKTGPGFQIEAIQRRQNSPAVSCIWQKRCTRSSAALPGLSVNGSTTVPAVTVLSLPFWCPAFNLFLGPQHAATQLPWLQDQGITSWLQLGFSWSL